MGALLFQYFIEALGLSAAIVALLAWRRARQRWLATYSLFMLGCLFYGAMRSVAYFLKWYVIPNDLEHSLAFFFIYCAGNSIFSLFIFWAGFHIAEKRVDKGRRAAIIAFVAAPMAAFACGAVLCALGRRAVLPPLFTASMFMALCAHITIQVYIGLSYRRADSLLKKRLIVVNNATGLIFLALSAYFYSDRISTAYYVDSFWALNLSYLVLFGGSAAFIAWHHFVRPAPVESIPAIMPENPGGTARDIMGLIMRGYSNDQIAAELGLSLTAVKNRIYRLFRKYGVQSRTELIYMVKNGCPDGRVPNEGP